MTRSPEQEEQPPVFKTWRRWYALVLGMLLAQVLLYYWITRAFL